MARTEESIREDMTTVQQTGRAGQMSRADPINGLQELTRLVDKKSRRVKKSRTDSWMREPINEREMQKGREEKNRQGQKNGRP